MMKKNDKLIFVLGILAIVFGLFLASPADARTGTVSSGVFFTPYVYPVQFTPTSISTPNINNNPTVIPGCEGRNTGFSITTGQSCVGNYVANTNTNTSTNTNTNTNNTKTTTKTSSTTNNNTNNTVTDNTKDTPAVSYENTDDVNENYGSLTANALLGSKSFMPTGLFQWIILALIVTAIIFLWRYVYGEEKYMNEPLKHA